MVPYTIGMIFYPHIQAYDQYWEEAKGCHKYKYGIAFKVATGARIINDFVTIYDGYDTDSWFFQQYSSIGMLFIVYVHDMNWQVMCKLLDMKTDKLVSGVLTNPRFIDG